MEKDIEEKKEKKIKDSYTNKLCDIEKGEIEKIEEINTGYRTEENGQERYIHKERKIQDKEIRRKTKQTIPFKVNRIRHSMIKYKIYKKKEEKINKKIKSVRKEAKERKWYEEKEELKKEYTKGSIKKIWDYLKRIKQKDEKRTYEHQPLEKKDNTKTVNTIENLERWREWMKENFCVDNTSPKMKTINTKTIENDNIFELLSETDYYRSEKHEREKNERMELGNAHFQ